MSGLADIINSGINTPTANGTILSGIINQIQGTKTAPITPALKAAGAKGEVIKTPPPNAAVPKSAAPAGVKLNLSNMNTPPQQTLPQPSSAIGIPQMDTAQSQELIKYGMNYIIKGYKGLSEANKESLPKEKAALDKYEKTVNEVTEDIRKMPTIPVMKSYQEITQKTREMFPLLTGVMGLAYAIFGKGNMAHKLNAFGENYSAMAQGLQQYNLKKFAIATQDWQNQVKEWQATTDQTLQKYNAYIQAAMTGVNIEKMKTQLLEIKPDMDMKMGSQLLAYANSLLMMNGKISEIEMKAIGLGSTISKNASEIATNADRGNFYKAIANKYNNPAAANTLTDAEKSQRITNNYLNEYQSKRLSASSLVSLAKEAYNNHQISAAQREALLAASKTTPIGNSNSNNGIPTVNTNQMNGQ